MCNDWLTAKFVLKGTRLLDMILLLLSKFMVIDHRQYKSKGLCGRHAGFSGRSVAIVKILVVML